MQEGEVSYSKVVDGYNFTWWCNTPECKQEHTALYKRAYRGEYISTADTSPERILPSYGIDPLFYRATLDSFKGSPGIIRAAKEYASNPKGNIFISGATGRGKTHLAVGILRELIKQGRSDMYFRYVPELILDLKRTFDSTGEGCVTERDVIDRYSEYKILFLDDLGVEKSTEYVVQALDTIIDHRLRYLLPTIVTSNLSIAEVEESISPRMASRLESGKVWTLSGEDWRKRR